MINLHKLNIILDEYKSIFVSQQWKEEKYKWIAVKHFQDHWDINASDFTEMFMQATNKTANLLASMNNFPRGMLRAISEKDPEAVRAMFINLYDESKDISERIISFHSEAGRLKEIHNDGTWKQHYQNLNSISTYLWLRYPDKYYIYKYSECREVAKELESEFIPKTGFLAENFLGGFDLYNKISDYLQQDHELFDLLQSVLNDQCYPDPALKTMTIDLGFYISRTYSKKNDIKKDEWFPLDYHPGITIEQWKELLNNPKVFNESSLEIMKRIKDFGGMATCKQLSVKYGDEINFYNAGSSSLAKRVAEATDCTLYKSDNENSRWWPILYIGKPADKEIDGTFIWKLRDELSKALDMTDLSHIKLFKDNDSSDELSYWWLNANPKIWSFSDIAVNQVHAYTLFNDNGNKRRIFQNFLDAKNGDIIIGYESYPVKKVVAIAEVVQKNDGENLYFKKIEGLSNPIEYNDLKNYSELERMEYFVNPQGSLFKLTKGEYDFIMDVIREENPLSIINNYPIYSKDEFLKEVYMSSEKYDTLVSLLHNKKNLILQGAPGVGKTFAAKRLAFSIMGKKDTTRVEFIQFHQNYSYEDFIMGFRPVNEGFELKNGVFYSFCQKAANNPEEPFFFIIDEINRGNISKIFGELLMLIEKEYRGEKATLAYNGMSFTIPDNLFLIGMMNTADRSLAMIDYALRRRFSFFEMEPGFNSDGFRSYQKELNNETFNQLIEKIKELNKVIISDQSLGKGFSIGHSYFCGQKECSDFWMSEVVEYDIIPMLTEYWFDEPEKLQRWENILRGVLND